MTEENQERALRRKLVGAFIKSSREKAGLTQLDLAKKLKYSSPQFISNWERGISLPPMNALPQLVQALAISPKPLINVLHRYQATLFKMRKEKLLSVLEKLIAHR